MKKTVAAGLGVCAIALAFAAKDPVIMTVNGVDVPKSEFEYLYNKNSQQQINPQTLDEYVEMFKLYKMKVADAYAEGIDTLPSFIKETEQYRHELAAPYLVDSVFLNKLVDEAYNRSKEEVEAYHIMLFKTRDAVQNTVVRQRADSILTELKGGKDFAEMAKIHSMDRGSSPKGGRMGWITSDVYPIAFEMTAFALPEGEISEIVESPVGYHILKGGKHRKARGKILVQHILRLTQGKDSLGQAQAKVEIDSLYNLAKQTPENFSEIASRNSEDRGSARQGGKLPWFGAGEMVAEFDSVAFSLKDGEISKPVKTAYGYHIIKRLDSQSTPSRDQIKPSVIAKIANPQDLRYKLVRDNQNKRLAKKHKGSINDKLVANLRQGFEKEGMDSTSLSHAMTAVQKAPLYYVDGQPISGKELVESLDGVFIPASPLALEIFDERVADLYNKNLVIAEEKRLDREVPDYHNLLKEYIDGSMLYEVSVRKVWDRAAKDSEGLNAYFNEHKDNYKWTEPHAKGLLIQAINDSVAELVKKRAAELAPDTLSQTLRKEFGKDISVDRVLVSKGTNGMVDNLIFDGPKVLPSNSKYTNYFMINPRVILEPEEVADVKGLVTGDYQNEFQSKWENDLRNKYPVTVDEKVLRQVKRIK